MAAYYNEFDPFAAAWLRELIKAKLIADGEVDERSITDVRPDDLRGFVQCHFFAGIGGWSYALRLAGWGDDRAVWTGSCPCQPFSSAGTQAGGHDPRDLWPVWFELVKECRPVVVFGEQVEAAIGHGWLDRLCDDLESEGYAVGPVGLPGPCVGAFDIRQRLWFVADANPRGSQIGRAENDGALRRPSDERRTSADIGAALAESSRSAGALADTEHAERRTVGGHSEDERDGRDAGRTKAHCQPRTRRTFCDEGSAGWRSEGDHITAGDGSDSVADAESEGRQRLSAEGRSDVPDGAGRGEVGRVGESDSAREATFRIVSGRPLVERGRSFWADADWIACRDGKARPVEPGTFPLAHGVPARVGRLRGYGNAIKPQLAAAFIEAYREAIGETI